MRGWRIWYFAEKKIIFLKHFDETIATYGGLAMAQLFIVHKSCPFNGECFEKVLNKFKILAFM